MNRLTDQWNLPNYDSNPEVIKQLVIQLYTHTKLKKKFCMVQKQHKQNQMTNICNLTDNG